MANRKKFGGETVRTSPIRMEKSLHERMDLYSRDTLSSYNTIIVLALREYLDAKGYTEDKLEEMAEGGSRDA